MPKIPTLNLVAFSMSCGQTWEVPLSGAVYFSFI